MGTNQQFSLRWNNYLHHITEAFDSLREDENLVDVTLCCEGRKIKAHKMLLSACSSYFREIFKENPCHHPIIVFHNVKYEDLWALVSFMYKGEVNVEQEGLSSFLNTAELLEVQGLTGGPSRTDETDDENSQEPKTNRKQSSPKSSTRPESPVPKRRKLPTDDGLKKEHTKSPLALVKTEPDFYGGDSLDESEDQKPQSLSLSQKLDKNYDNNYSDENMDGSSEIGTAGGSTNEMTNMPDSLQGKCNCLPMAFGGDCIRH
ncbi:broad-complex core protein isoforms 1/2/3/4/5 isoform X4 [Halyomorpha halys]|uniref:broad-complex core protein isoforms 1/2/3/4/5 isoform X4 n=1 Tax=Halyomorpha halys TaxID=286706 RepID=UPI0034D36402